MIQLKLIENEVDLFCASQLKKNQKFLCSECMDILESKAQLMSFKKVFQNIQKNQKQKQELVENVIMMNNKYLEQLFKEFDQLKSNVVQWLDQLIGNVDEWMKHLKFIGQQNVTYSFFDEQEKLIEQTKLNEFNQKSLNQLIMESKDHQKNQIYLNSFKQGRNQRKYQKFQKMLINEMIKKQNQFEVNQENNIKQQNK